MPLRGYKQEQDTGKIGRQDEKRSREPAYTIGIIPQVASPEHVHCSLPIPSFHIVCLSLPELPLPLQLLTKELTGITMTP